MLRAALLYGERVAGILPARRNGADELTQKPLAGLVEYWRVSYCW
jgi:hypothetical protein